MATPQPTPSPSPAPAPTQPDNRSILDRLKDAWYYFWNQPPQPQQPQQPPQP